MSDASDPDIKAQFQAFMRAADLLHMHPDERCDILGLSVEHWRALVRHGGDEQQVLHDNRVMRRLRYALGLMERRLANEAL